MGDRKRRRGYYKGHRRKQTWLDAIRGWHWVGDLKVRNYCGCVIA